MIFLIPKRKECAIFLRQEMRNISCDSQLSIERNTKKFREFFIHKKLCFFSTKNLTDFYVHKIVILLYLGL
jgi:hypothetical protein